MTGETGHLYIVLNFKENNSSSFIIVLSVNLLYISVINWIYVPSPNLFVYDWGYMWVYFHVGACMCAYMWIQRSDIGIVPKEPPALSLFLETGSLIFLELAVIKKPQKSTCLQLQTSRIIRVCYHTRLWYRDSGHWTCILMLMEQIFYWHELSPQPILHSRFKEFLSWSHFEFYQMLFLHL